MATTYGVTRDIGTRTYANSGFHSHEAALEDVYQRAFKNGDWVPPKLREKWWQIWRPTQHTKLEKKFLD